MEMCNTFNKLIQKWMKLNQFLIHAVLNWRTSRIYPEVNQKKSSRRVNVSSVLWLPNSRQSGLRSPKWLWKSHISVWQTHELVTLVHLFERLMHQHQVWRTSTHRPPYNSHSSHQSDRQSSVWLNHRILYIC